MQLMRRALEIENITDPEEQKTFRAELQEDDMSRVKLLVRLLNAPEGGETAVAMAARLCYSGANIDALREKVSAADQNAFIQRLAEMGHLSPIEHASFTFGIEGVSVRCSRRSPATGWRAFRCSPSAM